jgi:hypothetical protein
LPVKLHFSGTTDCRPENDTVDYLIRLLGENSPRPIPLPLEVEADIVALARGFRLTIHATNSTASTRIIESRSCDELAQAAALVLSLWLQERASVESGPHPEPLTPPESPEMKGIPQVDSRSMKTLPNWVLTSQLRLHKTHFAISPPRRLHLDASAGPFVSRGISPRTNLGGMAQLGLSLQRTHFELGVFWLSEQSTWKTVTGARVGGRFNLTAGHVGLGQRFKGSLPLFFEPSIWADLGRMHAVGLKTSSSVESRGAWGAAGLANTVGVELGRIDVGLQVGVGLPFGRPRFLVDEILIFQPPSVLGFGFLRLAYRFL